MRNVVVVMILLLASPFSWRSEPARVSHKIESTATYIPSEKTIKWEVKCEVMSDETVVVRWSEFTCKDSVSFVEAKMDSIAECFILNF